MYADLTMCWMRDATDSTTHCKESVTSVIIAFQMRAILIAYISYITD
jgi:hypothetical protein